MAQVDRFMIAPITSGLQNDLKPFLIPDDAFDQLKNAYIFRGRVRKRFGGRAMNTSIDIATQQLNSRLRVQVGTIGAPAGTVPGSVFAIGQMFSADVQMFTVYQTGTPAAMLSTGPGTGTYDTSNGNFVLAGTGLPGGTPIYFYPATPVMGFLSYEQPAINNEVAFAFDTQFAYEFNNGMWTRLTGETNPGDAVWHGSDSQFFQGTNFRDPAGNRLLFVTNFNTGETNYMRYFDGTNWTTFRPAFSATMNDNINQARLMISFRGRLLLLNTFERAGNVGYPNRIRFSMIGNPTAATAFYESPNVNGYGGFIDNGQTSEAIVGAQFIKDRLIIFFERSTWELVYTGNEIQPFRFQQIHPTLGAESTFSVVPLDNLIVGIGNVGIHACNGARVERIDDKIPDEVFTIQNDNDGLARVQGIRDYFTEAIYWSFPSENNSPVYPNQILNYNYKTESWSLFDDSITAFGYFQLDTGLTWGSTTTTWEETLDVWGGPEEQAQFPAIIAGNQEGFTFIVDRDETRNAVSLQITNITNLLNIFTLYIQNHNLTTDDFICIENCQGLVSLNNQIFRVFLVFDANTIFIQSAPDASVYTGGGTVTRVSKIDILTKQYNFYLQDGMNAAISKVDFYVDSTTAGQVTIDFFASSSLLSLVEEGTATNSILGNSILETSPYALYPLEASQERLWHPVYINAEGEVIQVRIYLSDAQMTNPDITWSDFQLNAMTFYATPTSSRLQ